MCQLTCPTSDSSDSDDSACISVSCTTSIGGAGTSDNGTQYNGETIFTAPSPNRGKRWGNYRVWY